LQDFFTLQTSEEIKESRLRQQLLEKQLSSFDELNTLRKAELALRIKQLQDNKCDRCETSEQR
jgi:hypothetical protein